MAKKSYKAPKTLDQLAGLFKEVKQRQRKTYTPKTQSKITIREQGQR